MDNNNPAKKKSKNVIVAVVLVSILAILIGVFVFLLSGYLKSVKDDELSVDAQPVEALDIVDAGSDTGALEAKEITNPSNNLFDMIFVLNGVEYQFPLKTSDFLANGWSFVDETKADEMVVYGEYKSCILVSGSNIIRVCSYNPSSEDTKTVDCYVGSVSPIVVNSFILPCNITLHKSTRFDTASAYGMPNSNSGDVRWYYGEPDKYVLGASESTIELMYNQTPLIQVKYDENCEKTGSDDNDIVKYIELEWYDLDVEAKYAERSAE